MKKLFTIFFILLSISAYSQPTMDGTFDGEGVWGAPKATADGTVGWAGANAKKLYTTFDATYFYLGAEVTASPWQAWTFIINTQAGGGPSDSWSRNISYSHTNLPDFTARGHFVGYAEIHTWNGSSWTGYSGLVASEFGENITSNDQNGWVEIRVPQSTLGFPLVSDVEFYITGDNNDHGSFDACPNDDNAVGWNDNTILSNYAPEIPLPVELVSFTASVIGNDVKLNWQTATEIDNYGFDIERSQKSNVKGQMWERIGFVNGHGNSNSIKNYNFTDREVLNGIYSYRLKQIDANGNFAYSPTVEVTVNNLPAQFELLQNYPNPFNPSTVIKYSVPSKEFVQLKVFNVLGNEIATIVNEIQEAGNYTIEFNASKMNVTTSGIYFYRLEAGTYVDSRKMTLVK